MASIQRRRDPGRTPQVARECGAASTRCLDPRSRRALANLCMADALTQPPLLADSASSLLGDRTFIVKWVYTNSGPRTIAPGEDNATAWIDNINISLPGEAISENFGSSSFDLPSGNGGYLTGYNGDSLFESYNDGHLGAEIRIRYKLWSTYKIKASKS